jgi:hypothetical protein
MKKIKSKYLSIIINQRNILDVPDTALCQGIKSGSEKDWDFILYLSDQNTKLDSKTLLLSLACTRDLVLLERYLNYQINSTRVKKIDSLAGIIHAAKLNQNPLQIWNFIKYNWMFLFEK